MTEQQARDFAQVLGAEIAHWRRVRRLSRADLAGLVDVSDTMIGRIERGSEDATAATTVVWRIAQALGLSFAYLVRRAEEALDQSDPSTTTASEPLQRAAYPDTMTDAEREALEQEGQA